MDKRTAPTAKESHEQNREAEINRKLSGPALPSLLEQGQGNTQLPGLFTQPALSTALPCQDSGPAGRSKPVPL